MPNDVQAQTKIDEDDISKQSLAHGEPAGYRELKAGEFLENSNIDLKAAFSGWLTVTKEFYNFPQINPDDFKSTMTKLEQEETGIASGVKGYFKKKNKQKGEDDDPADVTSAKLKQLRKKARCFGVIKHGNLFLYNDESQKNTLSVIVLDRYVVSMWPRTLTEGQLFTKRSAICLLKKDELSNDELQSILNGDNNDYTVNHPSKNCYFLYGDIHSEKEDWYFALLRSTKKLNAKPTGTIDDLFNPSLIAKSLHFLTADANDLIQTLNSTEDQLTTKWLNSIIGRLFLAVYQTQDFENWCSSYIEKKLQKIQTPGFLDNLQLRSVKVGHSAPFFTNPRLDSLSPEGDLDASVNLIYQGGCVVEIATKLFINMGVQREFDVILKIKVKKLQGDLLFRIKKAPSNRIWYAFTKFPELDLDIQPIFSSRALTYNLVTGLIENRLKEVLRSTLVMPFMDNFAFFDTSNEIFRAGIWDKKARSFMKDFAKVSNNEFPPPVPIRESQFVQNERDFNDVEVENEQKNSDKIHKRNETGVNTNLKTDADVGDLVNDENNSHEQVLTGKSYAKTTSLSSRKSLTSRHSNSQKVLDNVQFESTSEGTLKKTLADNLTDTDTTSTKSENSSRSATLSSTEIKIKEKFSNTYSSIRSWYNKIPKDKDNLRVNVAKNSSADAAPQTPIENDNHSLSSQSPVVDHVYGAAHPPVTDPSDVYPGRKHSRTLSDGKKKYNPPEMISNRRQRTPKMTQSSSSATFNLNENTARSSFNANSDILSFSSNRKDSVSNSFNLNDSPYPVELPLPTTPASPQMFLNERFKDNTVTPTQKRKSSGNFNIYTGISESGGMLELDNSLSQRKLSHTSKDDSMFNFNGITTTKVSDVESYPNAHAYVEAMKSSLGSSTDFKENEKLTLPPLLPLVTSPSDADLIKETENPQPLSPIKKVPTTISETSENDQSMLSNGEGVNLFKRKPPPPPLPPRGSEDDH